MNTSLINLPFRRIWLLAIIVCVLLAVPLSFFAKSRPCLIPIPILVGTFAVMLSDACAYPRTRAQLPLALKMPSGFVGLAKYKGYAALAIPIDLTNPDQTLFDFLNVQRRKITKTARVIRDPDTGE